MIDFLIINNRYCLSYAVLTSNHRATVLVEEDYETRHCECRIKDIACALW